MKLYLFHVADFLFNIVVRDEADLFSHSAKRPKKKKKIDKEM